MVKRISISTNRQQRGFTLIELLVVITILGILAGVVVFAVRGAGDKGAANAIAADERIIRTAMEAYCARHGTYPGGDDPMGVLVEEKFLSNRSEHHRLVTGDDRSAFPEGLCSGSRPYYRIEGGGAGPTAPSPVPCLRGGGTTVDRTADMWCMAAAPPGGDSSYPERMNIAQLKTGKVLVVHNNTVTGLTAEIIRGEVTTVGHAVGLFDPAAGPRGSWSQAQPVHYRPSTTRGVQKVILLDGRPGHLAEDCGDRCGTVLAYVDHWTLYDPEDDSWDAIEAPYYARSSQAQALQLLGPGCGSHCGKVVIVNGASEQPLVELYDPVTNTFQPFFTYGDGWGGYYDPQLAELPDGRVLLVSARGPRESPAFLLDLDLRQATQIESPPGGFGRDTGRFFGDALPTPLPEGRGILLLSSRWGAIYHPDDGAGSWEAVTGCSTSDDQNCRIMAALPDGRVLAYRSATLYWGGSNDAMIYDSAKTDPSKRWSSAGALNDSQSPGFSVLLSRGPCGVNCNRVLTVGERHKAELYSAA